MNTLCSYALCDRVNPDPIHTCTHKQTYTHTHISTHTHSHTHTRTHTHIHTCTLIYILAPAQALAAAKQAMDEEERRLVARYMSHS